VGQNKSDARKRHSRHFIDVADGKRAGYPKTLRRGALGVKEERCPTKENGMPSTGREKSPQMNRKVWEYAGRENRASGNNIDCSWKKLGESSKRSP